MAFLAPVDERALDVRLLSQQLGVVGRGFLRVALALERLQAPSLAAVVGVHGGQALEGDLGPDLSRPLLEDCPARLDLCVAEAKDRLPGQAK